MGVKPFNRTVPLAAVRPAWDSETGSLPKLILLPEAVTPNIWRQQLGAQWTELSSKMQILYYFNGCESFVGFSRSSLLLYVLFVLAKKNEKLQVLFE